MAEEGTERVAAEGAERVVAEERVAVEEGA